jgi:hypothetical protein
VTEAIAAAFGQWLLHKKKAESRRLRVSVGHDSRISAQTLLVCIYFLDLWDVFHVATVETLSINL